MRNAAPERYADAILSKGSLRRGEAVLVSLYVAALKYIIGNNRPMELETVLSLGTRWSTICLRTLPPGEGLSGVVRAGWASSFRWIDSYFTPPICFIRSRLLPIRCTRTTSKVEPTTLIFPWRET